MSERKKPKYFPYKIEFTTREDHDCFSNKMMSFKISQSRSIPEVAKEMMADYVKKVKKL